MEGLATSQEVAGWCPVLAASVVGEKELLLNFGLKHYLRQTIIKLICQRINDVS